MARFLTLFIMFLFLAWPADAHARGTPTQTTQANSLTSSPAGESAPVKTKLRSQDDEEDEEEPPPAARKRQRSRDADEEEPERASKSRRARDEDRDEERVSRKQKRQDEDEEEPERVSRKKKVRYEDEEEDRPARRTQSRREQDVEDVQEVPMSEKAIVLPFMIAVGIAPCLFPLAGLFAPFGQWRYVLGRRGFNNPLRGLAAGYLSFLGFVGGGVAYFCCCGGLSLLPGLLISANSSSGGGAGGSCMSLGFGTVWFFGVLAHIAFWLGLEPLVVWFLSQ